jgi:hypothetical protein
MTDLDLFGLAAGPMLTEKQRRRLKKSPQARGYAAMPGSGPLEETCGSCKNIVRFRRWAKCGLMRGCWTGGKGTDIEVKSIACRRWEKGSR